MANKSLTVCGDSCEDELLLPALPTEQECTSYEMQDAEICDLIIRPIGATNPFANWSTTPTAVSGAIDNADTTGAKCKILTVRGGIADYQSETIQYPKNKQKQGRKTYTAILEYFQMDQESYDFLRALQCGWLGFTFWYAALSNHLYGSAGGLEPSAVRVFMPKAVGGKQSARVEIDWVDNGDPERRVNPLA